MMAKELNICNWNIKEINNLVDQKYNLKKEKTKALIAAYAKIKEILSEKQEETLKEIMKEYFKGKRKCKN